MAEEEEKHHEKHHEEKHHEGLGGSESKKKEKLLWWGLGIGGAGLFVTLLLFSRGGSQDNTGTVANAPAPFVPNPQNPYDASYNEYWPVPSNTANTPVTTTGGGSTSTGGSSGSSGGSKKKKKKSSSAGGTSHKGPTQIMKPPATTVTPNPTAGGAHGWVYTTHGGETIARLENTWWSGYTGPTGQFLRGYANNAALLQSEGIGSSWFKGSNPINKTLPAGIKIIA